MIRFIQIVCISTLFSTLSAQSLIDDALFSAKTSAMGGAGSTVAAGSEAVIRNPARIGSLSRPDIHFFHTRLYNMSELPLSRIQAAFPLLKGWAGLSWTSLSNDLYQENLYTLGYAKNIIPNFSLGVSMVCNHVSINQYKSFESLSMHVGSNVQLNNSMSAAIVIRNIFISGDRHNRHGSMPVISAGLTKNVSEFWQLAIEAEHDFIFPLEIKGGTAIRILEVLKIRTGFRQQPSGLTWGFTLTIKPVEMDYSAVLHPFLGATHLFGFTLYP